MEKSLNKTSQAINVMSLSRHYEDAEESLIDAICIQIYMWYLVVIRYPLGSVCPAD